MSKFVELESIAELTVGYVGNMAKEYVNDGITFFRSLNIKPFEINTDDIMYISEEFNKKIAKSELHKGDLVIVRTGLPGTCCVIPDEYDGSNCSDLVIVRPNKNLVNPYYLEAYINFMAQAQINNNQVGAIQKHFNVGSAKKMLIFLPDMSIQNRIAEIVQLINYKIQNNNKINAELEAMAKTIYDYWFLQFDFPNENGKPYKSSGGKMVWNEELKREIPEGWEVKELLDFCDWQSASQPPKSDFIYEPQKGYIRFIQNRDYADSNNITYIPLCESTKICNRYDIMMDKYGDKTAGEVRYGLDGAYNVALGKISVNINNMQEYIRKYLESMFSYLHNACIASTRSSMNETVFTGLNVAIPSEYIRDKFEEINKKFIEKKLLLIQENQELASLRDFLLPMLMNGQIGFK